MKIGETKLPGVFVLDLERHVDERGHFARTYCRDVFAGHGLCSNWAQCNTSYNRRAGTLRGLHYQAEPFAEAKLIRCTSGAVWDVVADVRPESPTFGQWVGIELSARNGRAVYAPEGCAHGFQTLTDAAELLYQMSAPFRAELARGVRWNDPTLAVEWPACESRILSPRDAALPLLDVGECLRAS